ncbi:MAG: hypothetical protein DRP56_10815 [Planctomycetota bacterium]|nr:MAG: hypothetical protein DRP56_10815 [Planctomycetota bacterium]
MKDNQDKRIADILGDLEQLDFDQTIDTFYEYLKTNLTLPCEVIGIEDFRWEEIYVFGPGNKEEYEQLKKTQPSYTDLYELYKIIRNADESQWAMCFEDDIGAYVRRISDGKKFLLGLSELKATDKKSKSYQLLDDYSVWFVNDR